MKVIQLVYTLNSISFDIKLTKQLKIIIGVKFLVLSLIVVVEPSPIVYLAMKIMIIRQLFLD